MAAIKYHLPIVLLFVVFLTSCGMGVAGGLGSSNVGISKGAFDYNEKTYRAHSGKFQVTLPESSLPILFDYVDGPLQGFVAEYYGGRVAYGAFWLDEVYSNSRFEREVLSMSEDIVASHTRYLSAVIRNNIQLIEEKNTTIKGRQAKQMIFASDCTKPRACAVVLMTWINFGSKGIVHLDYGNFDNSAYSFANSPYKEGLSTTQIKQLNPLQNSPYREFVDSLKTND